MPNNDLDQREKDIQAICKHILETGVASTGDYGMGGECPFCLTNCRWDASLEDVPHDKDCIYLIAKDLSTNL